MDLALPLPAEQLMPHRPPMRLVERLVAYAGQEGVVEAMVAADDLMVAGDGRLDEVALAELLAQAYAVVKGYGDSLSGNPVREGFLVGIRDVVFERAVFAGDQLRIAVRTVAAVEGFAVAEGEVWRGDEQVAHGSLKLWIPEVDA
ncbi:3-hydroxyacyl-ACP dehydratase [Trichloromonas sp.]|uniref:3-hydroxyacyl-ACP dehydratase n=1 Tax=Trichloromonas sp. TaxID=3069249 RepID=UPI003D816BB5